MKRITLLFSLTLLLTAPAVVFSQYYKDVFMDGGIKLTSRERLTASELLGLSMEYFASAGPKNAAAFAELDSLTQRMLYVGSEQDLNGILLYPDGAPRFRLIYVNGGRATAHGKSMGEEGRENMRKFVAGGGTYVGTCAGAFFASSGSVAVGKVEPNSNYLGIWPGLAHTTRLAKSPTGMKVEKNSPLLKYYDFGGDMYIDSIYHNGGCYAFTEQDYPAGTEALLRYDFVNTDRVKIDGEISAWAYKKDAATGRVVLIGSHPEGVTSGERLDLMAAMMNYALDGAGSPKVKGTLEKDKAREMSKTTTDADPAFTMIGDKQYHHFTVSIPKKAKNVKIELEGKPDVDIFLYMKKGDFAFRDKATYKNMALGSKKELSFDTLEEGEWYIGVECATTVDVVKTRWGYEYAGRTDVLNGVPYTIKASWK